MVTKAALPKRSKRFITRPDFFYQIEIAQKYYQYTKNIRLFLIYTSYIIIIQAYQLFHMNNHTLNE